MDPVVFQTGLRLVVGTKDKYEEYQYYQMSDADHKEICWFLRDHDEFLEENGYEVNKENLDKLIDVFDSWVDGYYWLYALCGDDRKRADKYLNLAFNYTDVRVQSKWVFRWASIFKRILDNETPKEVFIPLINQYALFIWAGPEWDEMWLDACEWAVKQDGLIYVSVVVKVNENKDKLTPDNINKMTNFIMGQVIKDAKENNQAFDSRKIKKLVEKEISRCLTP